jgi:RNA polymerase sigma factor (sigma-70 family)
VLRRLAAQLAGDAHRGDDLVQQAITRLYLHWSKAAAAHNIDAYVHRILVRVFLDERRLSWAGVRLGHSAPDVVEPERGAPAQGTEVEDRLVLHAALAKLPPRQRAAVVLRYLADQSVEETADILRVSPGTVKSQTSEGLAALRRLLADRPTDPSLGVTS